MHLDELSKALSTELTSSINEKTDTKLASVLIVIFDSEPKILMTKKSKNLKVHGGDIAFPGGKFDEQDEDLLDTSLRETREEINLSIRRDQVIGQLKPVTTLNSGFTIFPYVTVVNRLPRLKDNLEVETILHIPMIPFLKTLANDPDPAHKSIQEMHIFTYNEHLVWGASARMLKQIVDVLSKKNIL